MPGSASGPGKRTDRKASTAPRSDSTPTLYAQCKALPWKDVPSHSAGQTGHGRRTHRAIKVVQTRIRTGNGPQVIATLRNTAISLLRLNGATNIAEATRHHATHAERPIKLALTS